jgi:hypothetical protein
MTTTPSLYPLVGLIGKKRAGKDTYAEVLTSRHGFTRVSFADPLRQAALQADPIVGPCSLPGELVPQYRRLSTVIEAIGWEVAKDTVPGVRAFLRTLGQAIREIQPDFWLDAGLTKIAETGSPVVVTDVRFPNEADAIAALGGTLVRIVRPETEDGDLDVSETALDLYPEDVYVSNVGTVDRLRSQAEELVSALY